jgi:hypothetical protein
VTCLETECYCVTVVQLGTVELYGAATEGGVLTEMKLKWYSDFNITVCGK